MSETKSRELCERAQMRMDSYISGELAETASLPLEDHIAQCSDCSLELRARKHLRSRLKTAVRGTSTPPFLEAKIRHSLRGTPTASRWHRPFAAVAAGALICLGLTVAYELGHLRFTTSSQDSYIASVSNRVATIMRVGLRDHIHCAVFRKYPKNPPKMDDLAKAAGPEYRDLVQIVKDRVPAGYQLMMAHQCRYQGRRFLHLALLDGSRTLSLVIAQKGAGESFETENLVPALQQAGIPIYHSGVQAFQIDAFESSAHLVYVISDLSRQGNLDLMRAMAPAVKDFLARIEG